VTTTVTTTVRVVNGVHNDTADAWTFTEVAITTSLTDLYVLVLFVADNAKRGGALHVHQADFTRWEAYLGVVAFFSH
jgi:hypothetical protein